MAKQRYILRQGELTFAQLKGGKAQHAGDADNNVSLWYDRHGFNILIRRKGLKPVWDTHEGLTAARKQFDSVKLTFKGA